MHKLGQEKCREVVSKAATALVNYCRSNGIHYLITGSSGGLDSAVTLALAKEACNKARDIQHGLYSVGIIMPCHSDPNAERLGRLAINTFQAYEIKIDLSDLFTKAICTVVPGVDLQVYHILNKTKGFSKDKWEWAGMVAQGNIKARLRMMFGTYHVARMLGSGMVLSTDNWSELMMGFWTICGDVGDFGMIQNVLKGLELPEIAKYLKVPSEIIAARPDDGNGVAEGGDEGQLGAPYSVVDLVMVELIKQYFNPNDDDPNQLLWLPEIPGVEPKVVRKLACRCLATTFKRRGTVNLTREQLGLPPITSLEL